MPKLVRAQYRIVMVYEELNMQTPTFYAKLYMEINFQCFLNLFGLIKSINVLERPLDFCRTYAIRGSKIGIDAVVAAIRPTAAYRLDTSQVLKVFDMGSR
jgi:hypothetical protein